jgi:hypothetical protein
MENGFYSYCIGCFNPPFGGKNKVITAGLIFKPLEFERFKARIAEMLPQSDKLDSASAAHPIIYYSKRLCIISGSRHCFKPPLNLPLIGGETEDLSWMADSFIKMLLTQGAISFVLTIL